VLVLDRNATPAILKKITDTGAVLHTANGSPIYYRRFVPVQVNQASLAKLATVAEAERIALMPQKSPLPMDHIADLIGLESARGSRPAIDRLTGKGVVVADLDSNAEVFHPQFFRGDAGYFDWIDVNGNGVLDPGVDAIDLDGDGVAGPDEIAVLLRQQTYSSWGGVVDARSSGFDPSIDWLYLDTNKNGRRDYGSANGFDDSVPAFGEPLFVPDDVNRNGRIDVGERLVRLGSSKFRKVYVDLNPYVKFKHIFERGVDLSSHKNNFSETDLYGMDEALHGTAVLSIIAGDVPLVGRRWVGIAPDVELVLGYEVSAGSSLAWVLDQLPDVVLYEMAGWTGTPLDGSDVMSSMLDESAVKDSVAHSCPVGNTGGSRKHAQLSVPAGAVRTLTVQVPNKGISYVDVSLNIRGANAVTVRVRDPYGSWNDADKSGGSSLSFSKGNMWITRQTTSRGTLFHEIILWTQDYSPLPTGDWTIEITGNSTNAAYVNAYVMDEVSSWGVGAAFPAGVADDSRTIGVPAVADHCIAVGAHTGHPYTSSQPWFNLGYESAGEVRGYSGRGPRIDGVQKPDIVAPDNPFAAAPYVPGENDYGAVRPFGGTSGAGPHVTGVTALLAEAGIRGNAATLAIRNGAIRDTKTGSVPNYDYGWGRLSAAGAFGVQASGSTPYLELTAIPAIARPGESVELVPVASDSGGGSLELRWDDGYDGDWDTDYGPVVKRVVTKQGALDEAFKARVRNSSGRIAEAVVWISAIPTDQDGGTDSGPDGDHSGDPGSGDEDPSNGLGDTRDGNAVSCGCRVVGARHRGSWAVASGLLMVVMAGLGRVRRSSRKNVT